MLTRILISLCLLLVPGRLLGQHAPVSTEQLLDIAFSDSLNGWIAGNGTLLRTTDGGYNWTANALSAGGRYFKSIRAQNSAGAWLLWTGDYYSYASHTTNAGMSWDTVLSYPFGSISKVSYERVRILGSNIWICESASYIGGEAWLERSTDGGATWTHPLTGFNSNCNTFRSVAIYSDSVVSAIFCPSRFHLTTNGGTTWKEDSLPYAANDLVQLSSTSSLVVCDAGNILRSTNAGSSWAEQTSGTDADLFCVTALDTANLWIVGANGTILNTTNGGSTWQSLASPRQVNLNAIHMFTPTSGWIVGDSGTIVHVEYGIPTGIRREPLLPSKLVLDQNYPNPFNPSTDISYTISLNGLVNLSVYDLLGKHIETLVDSYQLLGRHKLVWTPTNLSSGTYFMLLTVDGVSISKKIVLLR